jgi:hypothetical protein
VEAGWGEGQWEGEATDAAPDGCWAPGLSEVPEDVLICYCRLLDFFFRVADFVIVICVALFYIFFL